ncbi:MAG: GNAT family N-acetyltransferase [Bacteroidales bacterium]
MMNKLILETERLNIIPLTYNQLQLYVKADGLLERELGLYPLIRFIPDELVDAFENDILPGVANSSNYLFSTLWTIVLKEQSIMIGDLCFKGEPNYSGEVEIGYGIHERFQGKGYMTEAIREIIKWAFNQKEVRAVIAETDSDNISSHRVLEKCGFSKYNQVDGMYWWNLKRECFYE